MVLFYGGNSIVPSLLPFFIATEALSSSGIIEILGKKLNKFMKPIFNVPGEGAFPFVMGIITGYPVGAKIVSNLKENGIFEKYKLANHDVGIYSWWPHLCNWTNHDR